MSRLFYMSLTHRVMIVDGICICIIRLTELNSDLSDVKAGGVDTPEGDWWGIIFQDRSAVGRVLTLSPCRWIDGLPMLGDKIYLRIKGDFRLGRDKARCYYSTDGKSWASIGKEFQMKYDYRLLFMGQRFAIYNYSTDTSSAGGYIDVDYFNYRRLSEQDLSTEMTD